MTKQSMGLIFLILAILNLFGYLSLDEIFVFACSLGALFYTISDCFYDGLKISKLNISKSLNYLFKFLGIAFALTLILWKNIADIKTLEETIDANTILLCSLGFMLIASKSSEVMNKTLELKIREAVNKREEELLRIFEERLNIK